MLDLAAVEQSHAAGFAALGSARPFPPTCRLMKAGSRRSVKASSAWRTVMMLL